MHKDVYKATEMNWNISLTQFSSFRSLRARKYNNDYYDVH